MSIYQQTHIDNMKDRQQLMNYEAWLHNQYTIMAIGNALNGKKCKYPKKPFGMEENEHQSIEETEENYVLEMKSMIGKMNQGLK